MNFHLDNVFKFVVHNCRRFSLIRDHIGIKLKKKKNPVNEMRETISITRNDEQFYMSNIFGVDILTSGVTP